MLISKIKDLFIQVKDFFTSSSIFIKTALILVPVVFISALFTFSLTSNNPDSVGTSISEKDAPELVLADKNKDCLSAKTAVELETCLPDEAVKAALLPATLAAFDAKLNALIEKTPELNSQCYQSLRYVISAEGFEENFETIIKTVEQSPPTACGSALIDSIMDYGIRTNGSKYVAELVKICQLGPIYASNAVKSNECYIAIGQALLGADESEYNKVLASCEKNITGVALQNCALGYFVARYTEYIPGGSPFERSLSELPDICPSLPNSDTEIGCMQGAGSLLAGNFFKSTLPTMKNYGYSPDSSSFPKDLETIINSSIEQATQACSKFKNAKVCNNAFGDTIIRYAPKNLVGEHYVDHVCTRSKFEICSK